MTAPGLLFWRAASAVIAPGVPAWLHLRARRGKEVPERIRERWGDATRPRPEGALLWVHAASVGEAASLLPVLSALSRLAPDLTVLATTGTATSAALLADRLPLLGLYRVIHQFAPLDIRGWVRRFLDHWRPDAAAFVESELWPNTVLETDARGIPMALINARMSVRSFDRWRRAPGLARALLSRFRLVQAQSGRDAGRLAQLGARGVEAPGNLKFAAPPLPADPDTLARLREALGPRPVWLAASTHPGEEEMVLEAHRALIQDHPDLLTVIVPRHPERGAEIAARAAAFGATRRSQGGGPDGQVWVADTLGELGLFYRVAQVAFVGGSLVPHGGQNPLEAARLACPVVFGPHTWNFAEATAALIEAGGAVRVQDASALIGAVGDLLGDPVRRMAMGDAGAAAASRHGELPDRIARALLGLLGGGKITSRYGKEPALPHARP